MNHHHVEFVSEATQIYSNGDNSREEDEVRKKWKKKKKSDNVGFEPVI